MSIETEQETIKRATKFVIGREYEFFKDMMDAYDIADKTCDPRSKILFNCMQTEYQRLKEDGIFDHEEVYFGAGQYTSGRTGIKPRINIIGKL